MDPKASIYESSRASTHESTTLHMDTKEFIYEAKRAFTSESKPSGMHDSKRATVHKSKMGIHIRIHKDSRMDPKASTCWIYKYSYMDSKEF